ncbi:MAG: hypothetical protein HZB31_03535 [Nitrospirae bacterium]|nr:hypothetical protein [Nitrospirota bacterium]
MIFFAIYLLLEVSLTYVQLFPEKLDDVFQEPLGVLELGRVARSALCQPSQKCLACLDAVRCAREEQKLLCILARKETPQHIVESHPRYGTDGAFMDNDS